MKNIILSTIIVLSCCLFTFGHEVNKYRYLCIEIDENPYGIEKRINEEFMKLGFQTIDHEFYEEFDPTEKSLTLFADYDYFINYNGPSSLTLVLSNAAGTPIWKATGQGCTFLSAKGDMKGALKQIIKQFNRLKYKFDENKLNVRTIEHPYKEWTEDSIKVYLRTKRYSQIEGIYKNYSNSGDAYKIAILKDNDRYLGIILDSDNDLWQKNDIKIILNHIESNAFDVEFFDMNRQKINAIAQLEDDRVLQFSAPINGEMYNFGFLKVYPSNSDNIDKILPATNREYKSTGSGILISENMIITNYHVIEGAVGVDAVINVNGIPETFSAKVLCSDKTNDLALVCIKDDRFKGQGNIPFKISNKSVDVGTSVFAMGFPLTTFLGEDVKITDGIISSKTGFNGDIATYQITVPIQPGNSGGPLFDKKGNLVGITNAKIDVTMAENIGYAIKSPYVLNIIDSAPVNIQIPIGEKIPEDNLPELIKKLIPFVTYLKVY